MVQQLEQLLLGPGRAALGAEVVQDQQRRLADRLEQLVVAMSLFGLNAARRWSSRSGTTEKMTGSPSARRWLAMAAARWVLPQPGGPGQQQPALRAPRRTRGPARRSGGSGRGALGRSERPSGSQVVEGQAGQRAEVAEPFEPAPSSRSATSSPSARSRRRSARTRGGRPARRGAGSRRPRQRGQVGGRLGRASALDEPTVATLEIRLADLQAVQGVAKSLHSSPFLGWPSSRGCAARSASCACSGRRPRGTRPRSRPPGSAASASRSSSASSGVSRPMFCSYSS